MTMTSTLDAALADLPAKLRVHELSKRIGVSNKELLAALTERGLAIKSASASVSAEVAREVAELLLGAPTPAGEDADAGARGARGTASGPTEDVRAGGPKSPVTAAGEGTTDQGPLRPLFQAPAQTPVRTQPADSQAGAGAPDEAGPDSTGVDRPAGRRRRSRSGGGRKAADTGETEAGPSKGTEAGPSKGTEAGPSKGTEAGPSKGTEAGPGRAVATDERAVSAGTGPQVGGDGSADHAAPSTEGDADAGDDAAADRTSGEESDSEGSGRGRRRRRGRRGRGRSSDSGSDAAADDDDGDESSGTPEDDAKGRRQQDASADREQQAAERSTDGEAVDEDAEDDTDTDGSTADEETSQGGTRRRRRRRRRSGNGEDRDEEPRTDDPDDTVVHVREVRSNQAAAAEVQGVRGSTRLEAKRQRRRDSRESSRRRPQILTEAEFLARRESVDRVMAVRQRGDLAQVALLEDGILVEHFVSRSGADSMIGSVYLGKVQNVLPSMEAAFVDIGRGRNAVLYAGEVNWDAAGLAGKFRRIETALSSGDNILVQVSKDPIGHKGARLTTQISLPGRFLVYVPGGGATGISRKLPDTERKRLKGILDRIVSDDAGVIIRTAAEGIAEDELARDVERLKEQWAEINRKAGKANPPAMLYAEPGTLLKVVRDLFNSDISRLVIDGQDAYEQVKEYVDEVAPELAPRLSAYASDAGGDVFATYRVDEQLTKALERKVHLPSGGSLVIDRTEAMTVIDVNTGKFTGSGGNLEETVTKNNLEAAEEVVRQLRLRDIGGIVVVDFIDMILESNRELVMRRLTECLGRDRTRHQVAEVTSLGLVQMTRKRLGTGLLEAFSEPCEHCGGRGLLLRELPTEPTVEEKTDRRGGRSRRGRGRDAERGADVASRVHTVLTRPDPRGPKPRGAAAAAEQSAAEPGLESPVASEAGPVTVGEKLSAVLVLEPPADAELEAPEGWSDEMTAESESAVAAPDESARAAGEWIAPGDETAVEDGGMAQTGESGGSADREPADAESARGTAASAVPDVGAEPQGEAEPAAGGRLGGQDTPPGSAVQEPPAQPARRSRRRAAGRPAGAPSSAAAADLVIRPGSRPSGLVAAAAGVGAASGTSTAEPASGDGGVPQTVPARVRRRAATRPAGPAGQAVTPEITGNSADEVSAGSDAVPAGSDAGPTGNDAVSTGNDAVPTGNDAVPTGNDVVPAENDAASTEDTVESFTGDPVDPGSPDVSSDTPPLDPAVASAPADTDPAATAPAFAVSAVGAVTEPAVAASSVNQPPPTSADRQSVDTEPT